MLAGNSERTPSGRIHLLATTAKEEGVSRQLNLGRIHLRTEVEKDGSVSRKLSALRLGRIHLRTAAARGGRISQQLRRRPILVGFAYSLHQRRRAVLAGNSEHTPSRADSLTSCSSEGRQC